MLQTALVDRKRHRLDGEQLHIDMSNEALRTWGTVCEPEQLRKLSNPSNSIDLVALSKLWYTSYHGVLEPSCPNSNTLDETQRRVHQAVIHHQGHQTALDTMLLKLQDRIRSLYQTIEHTTSVSSSSSSSEMTQLPSNNISIFRKKTTTPTTPSIESLALTALQVHHHHPLDNLYSHQ
ncbi:hypothetical protein BDF19DRAFT_258524 [Syncephalis fuscata]|nr:hypothetical protein BDF19DRAFT_258524 [Syncephalis fuscata]